MTNSKKATLLPQSRGGTARRPSMKPKRSFGRAPGGGGYGRKVKRK